MDTHIYAYIHIYICHKQTLNSKGWELSYPYNCIGSFPESLTQGLLVGKLLVGGLGVSLTGKLIGAGSGRVWEAHPPQHPPRKSAAKMRHERSPATCKHGWSKHGSSIIH